SEPSLIAHLDRYVITEDVQLHGRSAECGEIFVTGPDAAQTLTAIGLNGESLGLYDHAAGAVGEAMVWMRRVDWLGQPGFLLASLADHLPTLWTGVVDAGARPAGGAAFHPLRIESGFPLYSLDISEDNLAQEAARTEQAISFTKGCYLGQEPIARIDALGHVNRELRGLKLAVDTVPPPGSRVIDLENAKDVGTVTSSAMSPVDRRPVALAYLKSQFTAPGTLVSVIVEGEPIGATVFWPMQG
ncbi:MAG: YgfZ/GcvT domain-containing protein, partial [Planctomycetaceae bacterium]